MKIKRILFFILLLLPYAGAMAQLNTTSSVLSHGTWYKMGVVQDGIYKLDYAMLAGLGIDVQHLDPDQIRVFGNESGTLPEKCSTTRFDDLNELSVYVSGADDGFFNANDYVLFYGQQTNKWFLSYKRDTIGGKDVASMVYDNKYNYYSDTTFYFLCVDSGVDGKRIATNPSGDVQQATSIITEFQSYSYHNEELMTPYFSGRNWYGEMISNGNSSLTIDFDIPNLVKEKAISVNGTVLGRTTGIMHYNVVANSNILVSDRSIGKYNDTQFGRENSFSSQFFSTSDNVSFTVDMVPDGIGSLLYLDFIRLNYWRKLIRCGDMFMFGLVPEQLTANLTTIWVQDAPSPYQIWDVTTPLTPMVQQSISSGGNMLFAIDDHFEKRYVIFNPAAAMTVLSCYRIANQNVHAISDAEMLIITNAKFASQAEELAAFHAEKDAMNCVIVDVDEIFNEFSTGTPDPTGMRDFIRMVYQRSGNLKYVLLFGKASADFRDIEGLGGNYVPCYESDERPYSEPDNYCSDDFFGLMDDEDGPECVGYLDLGVGRLPVSTVEDAEICIAKIRQYADLSFTHGEWKNNHLFMADDQDVYHAEYCEMVSQIMDTTFHVTNIAKLYTDSYPRVSTSSGYTYPEANKELMRRFSKGMLAYTYMGHGGVRGLTDEEVFTNSDILEMTNADRLPFLFTATCEFSKYDSPKLVSAGELMMIQPNGGAIAMLTSTRSTYPSNNFPLAQSFAQTVFQREGMNGLRFGDIYKLVKTNPKYYKVKNRLYVLLGDPALRLAYPNENIVTNQINGTDANSVVKLHAMSIVEVQGEITDADGERDTDFNGVINVKLFDKESQYTTLGNGGSETLDYSFFNDVLFDGKASVTDGTFSCTFQIPFDINYSFGTARLTYYAYDSIRKVDANGVFENISLGGMEEGNEDNEGPVISFYLDTPSFVNGDTVANHGVLHAILHDEQGISHYESNIGRDILLTSNVSGFQNILLNDYFVPELDNFKGGTVSYPLTDLADGVYEFTIRAWDTQNNSSQSDIWFVVGEAALSQEFSLSRLVNYPNPFNDETSISFSCGEDGNLDVQIEFFNVLGQRVGGIERTVSCVGGVVEPITCKVADVAGNRIQSGVYLYRVTLKNSDGECRSATQRMVIVR